jgi:hypothetical protein
MHVQGTEVLKSSCLFVCRFCGFAARRQNTQCAALIFGWGFVGWGFVGWGCFLNWWHAACLGAYDVGGCSEPGT